MEYDFYGCVCEKDGSLFLQKPLFETVKKLSDSQRSRFESLLYNENGCTDYSGLISYIDSTGAHYQEHNLREYWPVYIYWVDSFFSNCMFPLEFNDCVWQQNISAIFSILKRADCFMKDVFTCDTTAAETVISISEHRRLLQNNTVCFLVAYSYTADSKGFRDVLKLTHIYTLANIRRLVSATDPEALWNSEIQIDNGVGIVSHEYWQEPFSWVVHEFADIYIFESSIINTYSHYLQDLYDLYSHNPLSPLREIIDSTEVHLRELCDRSIDFCEYDIEDLEEKLGLKVAERDEYAKLLRESEERVYYGFTSQMEFNELPEDENGELSL